MQEKSTYRSLTIGERTMKHVINILILLILTGMVVGLAYVQLCLETPDGFGFLWIPLIVIYAVWLNHLRDTY